MVVGDCYVTVALRCPFIGYGRCCCCVTFTRRGGFPTFGIVYIYVDPGCYLLRADVTVVHHGGYVAVRLDVTGILRLFPRWSLLITWLLTFDSRIQPFHVGPHLQRSWTGYRLLRWWFPDTVVTDLPDAHTGAGSYRSRFTVAGGHTHVTLITLTLLLLDGCCYRGWC